MVQPTLKETLKYALNKSIPVELHNAFNTVVNNNNGYERDLVKNFLRRACAELNIDKTHAKNINFHCTKIDLTPTLGNFLTLLKINLAKDLEYTKKIIEYSDDSEKRSKANEEWREFVENAIKIEKGFLPPHEELLKNPNYAIDMYSTDKLLEVQEQYLRIKNALY